MSFPRHGEIFRSDVGSSNAGSRSCDLSPALIGPDEFPVGYSVRSMGIGAKGISFVEQRRRKALKQKVLRSMRSYKPGLETFAGLGPHPGFPAKSQVALTFPAQQILAVAMKIVRGCEYLLAKRIIEEPYRPEVYFAHERVNHLQSHSRTKSHPM